MIQGPHTALLEGVRAFDLHGQRYYDILYALEGGERGRTRVGPEVIYADPKEGDRVVLHFLMGMVTRVEQERG